MPARRTATVMLLSACLAACTSGGGSAATSGSSGGGGTLGTGGAGGAVDPEMLGGDRPVHLYVPTSYDGTTPYPVLILLHGHGISGLFQEAYMQFEPMAEARGFLYAHPDGLPGDDGKNGWNAFGGLGDVDDTAYLIGLVHEIAERFNVDAKRVYFAGHSNGGFMSLSMACDHADEIAAVMSFAGAMPADSSACAPTAPVSVLALHGTSDDVISYDGGKVSDITYAGALEGATLWASLDGCDPDADTTASPVDVDGKIDGAETSIARWATGCKAKSGVELWSIAGSGHIPIPLVPGFASRVVDFLFAHPKP